MPIFRDDRFPTPSELRSHSLSPCLITAQAPRASRSWWRLSRRTSTSDLAALSRTSSWRTPSSSSPPPTDTSEEKSSPGSSPRPSSSKEGRKFSFMSNDFFYNCKNLLLVSLINLWSPTFILIVGAGCKSSSGEYSDLNGPAPKSRGEGWSSFVPFFSFWAKVTMIKLLPLPFMVRKCNIFFDNIFYFFYEGTIFSLST